MSRTEGLDQLAGMVVGIPAAQPGAARDVTAGACTALRRAYKQYVAEAMASVTAPAGADEVDGGSTAEAARTGDVTSGDSEVSNSAPESKQRQALYSESALHCHFTVQDVQSVAPATFQVCAVRTCTFVLGGVEPTAYSTGGFMSNELSQRR